MSFCISVCLSCVVEKLWSLRAISPERSFFLVKHGLDIHLTCVGGDFQELGFYYRFPGLFVHPKMSWLWLDFHGAGKHDFTIAFCQHEVEKPRKFYSFVFTLALRWKWHYYNGKSYCSVLYHFTTPSSPFHHHPYANLKDANSCHSRMGHYVSSVSFLWWKGSLVWEAVLRVTSRCLGFTHSRPPRAHSLSSPLIWGC